MAQIAKELGDLDHRAATKAAQRFEASLASDKTKRPLANNCLTPSRRDPKAAMDGA